MMRFFIPNFLGFSPRPWGWSGVRGSYCLIGIVFPAPVGMVRLLTTNRLLFGSFPRARGDGPTIAFSEKAWVRFSPRPWGWSGLCSDTKISVWVFPAPVGMVRKTVFFFIVVNGFPRARGDGPSFPVLKMQNLMFSPRPWGWSAETGD